MSGLGDVVQQLTALWATSGDAMQHSGEGKPPGLLMTERNVDRRYVIE